MNERREENERVFLKRKVRFFFLLFVEFRFFRFRLNRFERDEN